MKHIISLCLAVFFMAGIQNAQAQTKEDTIAWLKEKLEKCLEGNGYSYGSETKVFTKYNKNVKLESINECEFIISYDQGKDRIKVVFPTRIKSFIYDNWEEGLPKRDFFDYSAAVVKKINLSNSNKIYYSSSNYDVYIAIREENILERIEKALKHLATFCPKKQEIF